MVDDDLRRFRANRQGEVDSAAQYRAMAAAEPDAGVARIYRELAEVEEKHAGFWETKMRDAGVDPGPRRASWRARVLRNDHDRRRSPPVPRESPGRSR